MMDYFCTECSHYWDPEHIRINPDAFNYCPTCGTEFDHD